MTDYNWYCLRTLPRKEQATSEALRGLGLQTIAPRIRTIQRTRHRTNQVTAPLFASYLFAKLCLESHYGRVRKTHGVAYFVGFDGAPFVVPDYMLEELASRMDGSQFVALDNEDVPRSGYEEDERIAITGGVYFGQEGLFKRDTDNAERVILMLKMLGGEFERAFDLCDTTRVLQVA